MRYPLWVRVVGVWIAVSLAIVTDTAAASACPAQRLAVPAYWGTDAAGAALWSRLANATPKVGTAIVGITASGPGPVPLPEVSRVVRRARSAGVTLLSYVDTGYTGRDPAEVMADISNAFRWYGTDGIFLDQVSNTCDKLGYYQALHDYVKKLNPKALVVLNPGTNTHECYVRASDTLLTFEGRYQDYVRWSPTGWEYGYPANRFWHLVFDAADAKQMRDAVTKSRKRHAGHVYVTDHGMPNPWEDLPTYWCAERGAVAVGR